MKVSFFKPKEAWYRLSPEERNEVMDKILGVFKKVGVKQPLGACTCYWSNEEWTWLSVEVYPDIEAVKKLERYIWEIGWQRYFESKLYLSTQEPMETALKMIVMA